MTLLDKTKLIYTALGIGAIGGTGAGAYYYLSNSDSKETNNSITPTRTISIAAKLSEEKYQLLDSVDDDWTQILEAYKANQELHFEGFDGTKPDQDPKKELQRLCNEATKLDSSKDTNNTYKKAKKWCTKPRTLTNVFEGKGYKMLNTATENDPDSEKWNIKLSEHKNATTSADKRFASLELESDGVLNETNRGKLKAKCKPLETKKHYEKEFEKELDQAILWCATNS